MPRSVQPLTRPAQAEPRFGGYRDRDRNEPGKVIDGFYNYEFKDAFKALIREAQANHYTEDTFNWDTDIPAELHKNLDGMDRPQLEAFAKHAAPALSNYPKAKLKTLLREGLPQDTQEVVELKQAIVERQLKALNSIANHAQTAERPSVEPLTFAIKNFNKYPHIQQAYSEFINDEGNHGDYFLRYIEEKLGEEEQVSLSIIKKFATFKALAKASTPAALVAALSVEAMGNSYFEFFGEHAPDPLFRELCQTISDRDEKFHIELFRLTYNKLFNEGGTKKEKFRNKQVLKFMIGESQKSYKYFREACLVFGVDPKVQTQFTINRLKDAFEGIPGADEAFQDLGLGPINERTE